MILRRLLNRLFTLEEINGGERCPTYLYRWTLFQPRRSKWLWGGFGIYLHNFVGDDWSRDLHDHPKRFISIGLWGSYLEESAPLGHTFQQSVVEPWSSRCVHCADPAQLHTRFRIYRAPWVRTFAASHIHRLSLISGRPCWTLVIVLRASRPWGFWHHGFWVPWRQYVNSDAATQSKSCP